jgi:hypothetical protein
MAKAAKKRKASPKRSAKAAGEDIGAKRANAYAEMEPHLGDVVRMGQIASMLFDNPDEGLSSLPSRTLKRCRNSSGRATTPWTSCDEAPAPIDQKAQPPAAGRSRKTAQAVTANRGARAQVRASKSGNIVRISICSANQFGTSISAAGVFGCTQPAR